MARLIIIIWAVLLFSPPALTAKEYGGSEVITGIKTPDQSDNQVSAVAIKTESHKNPFNKFEKMDAKSSAEELEKIDEDITAFILNRCGKYYTSVAKQKLTTTTMIVV